MKKNKSAAPKVSKRNKAPIKVKRVDVAQEPVEQSTTSPQSVVNNACVQSDADKFWEQIKDVKIELFSLPNQFVASYYKPISVEPTKLYLLPLTQASAVLPALENAIGARFDVTQSDRFILVTLKTKS